MATTDTDEVVDLMAQIAAANARDLAFTTDSLLAGVSRTARDMTNGLLAVLSILDEATVIDRRTQARLDALGYLWTEAERTLEHLDRMGLDGINATGITS